MDKDQLKLQIKNIRSVSEADIVINGITVIVGENGSGKSTISKLTYQLFKTSINFDSIIDEKIKNESRMIYRTVDNLFRELSSFMPKDEYMKVRGSFRRISSSFEQPNLLGIDSNLNNAIDYLKELLTKYPHNKLSLDVKSRLDRIKNIIAETLHLKSPNNIEIPDLLDKLKNVINTTYDKASSIKEVRPLSVLFEALEESFYDNPIPKTFDLKEYGVSLIDSKNKRLIPLHSIQHVAYIDTPMMLGMDFYAERSHWEDLNKLLKQRKGSGIKNRMIDSLFQKTVFKGIINLKEDDFSEESFFYKRDDGNEFNLIECATGLKSFAILQILYKNGFLNKNSLLIIDEPEVHLHPQWVVEYARLIILLNKNIGVKFLIASHHPDMISAIRYISEKENTNENLNFYLAQKKEENYTYSYKQLGLDIEPIFSSFNIALERIDLYGKTN